MKPATSLTIQKSSATIIHTISNEAEVKILNTVDLIRSEAESFPVPEFRRMLGVGKTESYWILKHRNIETVRIKGQLRIVKKSFWHWYDHQTKYRIADGPMPGEAIRAISYSVKDLMELLSVSEYVAYTILSNNTFETLTIDYCTRITKESFEKWYSGQSKFRMPEGRALDAQLLDITYSMPEIRRILRVHRNTVYDIVANKKNKAIFEFVTVAGQKRITIASFERWYQSQKRYLIHTEPEDETLPTAEVKAISDTRENRRKHSARPVEEKQFYQVEDLMDAFGISIKAAYKLIQTGDVIALRVGKSYLISAAEFVRITERSAENGDNNSEK